MGRPATWSRWENISRGVASVRIRPVSAGSTVTSPRHDSGTKGHIDDGRLWERDFSEFVEWVQRRHTGIPLFLYGQSMGSLVAMLVLSESNRSGHQIRPAGIILHSPAVAMIYASPIVRLGVAQLRSLNPRALLFRIGLISGEKPALTNNPKFDRYWGLSRDRVRPGFSWAFFDETLKLGARARTAASSMEVPVIVLTGDKDPIGTAGVGQGAFARFMRSFLPRKRSDSASPTGTTI